MEKNSAMIKELHEAIKPLENLIQMIPVAAAVVCADEMIPVLLANKEFSSLFDVRTWSDMKYFNSAPSDCMRLYKEFRRSAKEEKSFETEFYYIRPDEKGIWIRVLAVYDSQVGETDVYFCCFLDITAEKERDATGEILSESAVSYVKKMVGSGRELAEGHENYWNEFAQKETKLVLENERLKKEIKAVQEEANEVRRRTGAEGCNFSCRKTGICSMASGGREVYCQQINDAISMKERFKHDSLTGAWSREHFFDVVNKRLQESNAVFQVIALDLDKFKYINEYYGRGAGNTVLKIIAERLLAAFGKNAAIAHSYADKFYICVQSEGIRPELIDYIAYDKVSLESGEVIKVSIKLGIFSYDASSKMYSIDECIDRALMARATIKGRHGKTFSVYTTELEEKMREENEIEGMMEKALENREYVVFYQPKFSLETGALVGAEALVRWNSPVKGMISPGMFVPLFEKNGFIVKLDFYVYEEVCKFIRKLMDEGYQIVPISINVSRAHIETTDFVERLVSVVDGYGIPHHYIEIEMTESTYGAENENVIRIVNELKGLGFSLSMDDFGSGYSSLNLLKSMPIDVLKIDKEFLGETDTSRRSREIIRMIVEMSKAIDIRTICEGVETDQQAEFLRNIGCDMVQGFLFARPMPEENYLEVVRESVGTM